MPVRLATNVDVKNVLRSDASRLQSRKKSRLSVYLNTTAEQNVLSTETITLFSETDVQNAIQTQQERKRRSQEEGKKLKLVWKGNYTPSKSPQESLTELLTQRNTPRKVRFTVGTNRKSQWIKSTPKSDRTGHSQEVNNTTASLHGTKQAAFLSESLCGNSSNQCDVDEMENFEDVSYRCSHRFSQKLGLARESFVFHNELEYLLKEFSQRTSLDGSSTTVPRTALLGKRVSRTIFQTKRTTDHQEHNMFSYLAEKKRTMNKKGSKEKIKEKQLPTRTSTVMKASRLERQKLVPEMKDKVDVDTILRAYLSEQFLDLNLEGEEAASLRLLYESTIMHQPVINNLIMQHPDMLPARIFTDLVTFKKGFEVSPIYSPTVVKAEEAPWRELYAKSLNIRTGNVLIELEQDVPQYAHFYKALMEVRTRSIKIDKSWLRERKSHVIHERLLHTAVAVRVGRQNPGSTVRFDLLQIFEAAARNNRLLRQVSLSVDGWLNQLVQGLQAPFKSVRDETCQVLCIMTSSYSVMRELYLSKYFDVVQDICLSVLRAIEQFEDTFPEYYILLAHVIHYCPSRSIIDCILDRWNYFRSIGLILQWPRLIYYALRYWPDDALCLGSRLFSLRVTKALEAAMQRPITAKVSRSALYYAQTRFKNVSRVFTIYYDKESTQSRFMAAHAGRHA